MIVGTAPDALVFTFYRADEDEPHRVLTTVPQQFDVNAEEEAVPRGTSTGARA